MTLSPCQIARRWVRDWYWRRKAGPRQLYAPELNKHFLGVKFIESNHFISSNTYLRNLCDIISSSQKSTSAFACPWQQELLPASVRY